MGGPTVPADEFRCEQLPFDHPLWVLFSSGTTVYGSTRTARAAQGAELSLGLRPGDRAFFFTTTGWMMWNFLVGLRVVPVLYDGNPSHPDVDVLWRIAQDSRAALFGASPRSSS